MTRNPYVSTHSRLKAAGWRLPNARRVNASFNTQPPEGGWSVKRLASVTVSGFNTQPPEGGWDRRRKYRLMKISFNTQPPEGGWPLKAAFSQNFGSFNTQPPEGGWRHAFRVKRTYGVSTHSRLKAAGVAIAD